MAITKQQAVGIKHRIPFAWIFAKDDHVAAGLNQLPALAGIELLQQRLLVVRAIHKHQARAEAVRVEECTLSDPRTSFFHARRTIELLGLDSVRPPQASECCAAPEVIPAAWGSGGRQTCPRKAGLPTTGP